MYDTFFHKYIYIIYAVFYFKHVAFCFSSNSNSTLVTSCNQQFTSKMKPQVHSAETSSSLLGLPSFLVPQVHPLGCVFSFTLRCHDFFLYVLDLACTHTHTRLWALPPLELFSTPASPTEVIYPSGLGESFPDILFPVLWTVLSSCWWVAEFPFSICSFLKPLITFPTMSPLCKVMPALN